MQWQDDDTTFFYLCSTVAVKPDEFREEEYEEKMQRAEFFQQLVLSTIF